ncbi:ABC transporter permease [Streptosporangium sp. NPDC051022]|uniref:ABC transporter permease n=1 Tax=Streptosporangium sp. NPDC051022 TaxID=3155752 RepID=UPI003416F419
MSTSGTYVSSSLISLGEDALNPSRSRRLRDLVAAEWLKIRSLRSTYYLLAVFPLPILLGGGLALTTASSWDRLTPEGRAGFDATGAGGTALQVTYLVMAAFGILAITSESTTGMLRMTLTAVPRRGELLTAKALVVGVVSLVIGQVSAFAIFFASQAILNTRGIGVTLAAPYALPSVLGAGFSCMVMGLVGLGLGTLLRSTGAAFVSIFALLFVIPPLASLLPTPWHEWVGSLTLPMASNLLPGRITGDWFPPAAAALVLLGYVAVSLVAAGAALSRRDP